MGRSTTLLATAVATLLAAAAAQGQEVVTKKLGEVANPDAMACTYSFTASNIKWCLNANGNLVSLRSPGEIEHIRYKGPLGPGAIVPAGRRDRERRAAGRGDLHRRGRT